MILEGTSIEIPDSLVVPGDLFLMNTNATSLPAGLLVCVTLFLSGTNITSVPDGLSVGGWRANDSQLIASEPVQLELIGKNEGMLQVFKATTEKARRLHQLLWEL